MPFEPRSCWMNDRLVAWADAVVPVEDRGLQLGESLYEVVPVTAGQPRLLDAHAARLADGAVELGLASGAPDIDRWHCIAEALIAREAVEEGLLYVQLTGGAAPRDHLQVARPHPTLIAYLRRHRFPRRDRVDQGLRAITIADTRWARCDLKTTMLLPAVLAKREAAARNADEAILVAPDGSVREGASTSLLAVVDGALVSLEPSQHLLPGTMSTLVTEAAEDAGIATRFRALDLADLYAADEILLSATSKLVLPVLELDGRPVGHGTAGAVVHELADRIRRRLALDDT